MKKIIFQSIALCIAVQSMAQALCVKQSDGTISEFALSRVDSVSSVTAYTGFENGHEWVDLGLPSGILWSSSNVEGDYSWGETTTKTTYDWSTYKYANGSYDALTKYNNSSSYGTVDNKTVLEAADDAATQNWGGKWRMPTIDEWQELIDNCTWTWNYPKKFYKGRGPNGNSIFLPTVDYNDYAGSYGSYWSSSLYTSYPGSAQSVYFNSDNHGTSLGSRDHGHSVRPVYDEKIKTYTISLAEMENGTIVLSDTTAPAGKKITFDISPNSGFWLYSFSVKSGENEVTFTDNSFIMPAGDVQISAIFVTGLIYADLGLPSGLLWASCNIGATAPEEYGNYYAWGETTTKTTYNWSTYKYANGSNSTLTKYCDNSKYGQDGFTDTLTTLEAADDAATQNWSGNWRMPTDGEWQELIDNCTWSWISNYNSTSIAGYQVVSKNNGNRIFLPAAGCRYGVGLYYAGSSGYYWSSSLLSTYCPYYAMDVHFNSDNHGTSFDNRYYGQSVRPVYDEKIKIYTISLAEMENGTIALSDITAPAGKKITLTITSNFGYLLHSLNVMCGENEVAVIGNSFIMPAGDVQISAIFVTGSYVDLGLPSGLLWATCNVGSTSPEDYGNYYAWGETTTKSTYDWSTYKYTDGSSTTLTKYCTVDNKTTLEAADDAATQNWGSSWRIPTIEEWEELLEKCTWTWTTKNSVNGYEVRATNGNSIFLPAASCRINDELYNTGSCGCYWSSSLSTYDQDHAQHVGFDSDSDYHGTNHSYRYDGLSIRPVCKK